MDLTSITPPPAALKALAHPVRLRMLGLLRSDGPATATTLATRLGLNTGATSYHLRQLAAHGFVVEDAARGNARDRWWAAAQQSTTTDRSLLTTREDHETLAAYVQAVAVVYTEQLQRAVEEIGQLPEEWLDASTVSDWQLTLTPSRAKELKVALAAVVSGWAEDDADTPGAAAYVVNLNAYPRPGTVASGEGP